MTEETRNEDKQRRSGWLSALLFFGAVALVVAGILAIYPRDEPVAAPEETPATSTTAVEDLEVGLPDENSEPVAAAAEVILPSVVHIQTASGVGSGVVYDDGLIITAAHVVEGSDTVRVRFTDGEQVNGTVLGAAPEVDIAVIQVEKDDVVPATFATEKPKVGQMAVAVGSPWGLASTVTAGIISAVDQTNCSRNTCASMLQTDAAINPGNSGGALVNREGHVVGINVSIFTETGANDGVGFAVPADIATRYADAIVSGEPIETAFLGVSGENVDVEGRAGARIVEVTADSAADTAGIEPGDVIIGFDGVPVFGIGDLQAQVRAHQPGETVEVIVQRGDEEITLTATLGVASEEVG